MHGRKGRKREGIPRSREKYLESSPRGSMFASTIRYKDENQVGQGMKVKKRKGKERQGKEKGWDDELKS